MNSLFESIDFDIRSGRHKRASSRLREIKIAELSREDLVVLSDFGRRLQDPMFSLKSLGKTFRGVIAGKVEPTDTEIISYSRALVKMGFFNEADRWIQRIADVKRDELLDLQGRKRIAQWDYAGAVYFYKRYVSQLEPSSYSYLVAKLNLSASLVGCSRFDEAITAILSLKELAVKNEHSLIFANACELMAQALILSGDFDQGLSSLKESHEALGQGQSIYSFYLRKWTWVANLLKSVGCQSELSRAIQLKQEAEQNQYWEDVRDIDRRLSEVNFSEPIALKLYFGTPHRAYRESIKRELLDGVKIPPVFNFHLGPREGHLKEVLALENCFNPGSRIDSLFKTLTHDFYRPISLGYLFSRLYPDEYFDPHSSPTRVYRLVTRLRKRTIDNFGVDCVWNQEGIRLVSSRPVVIPVEQRQEIRTRQECQVAKMRKVFRQDWFTTKGVSEQLQISQRSAQELLKTAKKKYRVNQQGKGRSTRYRFAG